MYERVTGDWWGEFVTDAGASRSTVRRGVGFFTSHQSLITSERSVGQKGAELTDVVQVLEGIYALDDRFRSVRAEDRGH